MSMSTVTKNNLNYLMKLRWWNDC